MDPGPLIDEEHFAELAEVFGADLASLIDDWHRRASEIVTLLHAAVAVSDAEAVARLAHELKGLSATTGATRVAAQAAAIEAVMPDDAVLSRLEETVAATEAALRA